MKKLFREQSSLDYDALIVNAECLIKIIWYSLFVNDSFISLLAAPRVPILSEFGTFYAKMVENLHDMTDTELTFILPLHNLFEVEMKYIIVLVETSLLEFVLVGDHQ